MFKKVHQPKLRIIHICVLWKGDALLLLSLIITRFFDDQSPVFKHLLSQNSTICLLAPGACREIFSHFLSVISLGPFRFYSSRVLFSCQRQNVSGTNGPAVRFICTNLPIPLINSSKFWKVRQHVRNVQFIDESECSRMRFHRLVFHSS